MKDHTAELVKYYNCIRPPRIFKNNILNDSDELYYGRIIEEWVKLRNNDLPLDNSLSERTQLLQRFNNKMGDLLYQVVKEFSGIIEWKETKTKLHPNSIEVRINGKIQPLKDFPIKIKMNYGNNAHLAVMLQEHCINGLELMISFLKTDLLIDIQKAPCYFLFENLINEFKNAIDSHKAISIVQNEINLNKVKMPKPQQLKKDITISFIATTLGVDPNNLDYSYNRKLQFFYFQNSEIKDVTPDEYGNAFPEYDENGNIINATFNKIYPNGVEVKESDFIEQKLIEINKLERTQLKPEQRAKLDLWSDFLNNRLELQNNSTQENAHKLTVNQIALLHVYSNRQITRSNGNEVAKSYGHTSGEYLFHRYTHYNSRQNRIGNPDSEKKLSNKIKLFESLLEIIPKNEQLNNEINTLKSLRL